MNSDSEQEEVYTPPDFSYYSNCLWCSNPIDFRKDSFLLLYHKYNLENDESVMYYGCSKSCCQNWLDLMQE